MKVAAVEVIPYALPFRKPYVTARGRLERREMVLLRVRDEDGIEGLGEAVPLSLRGGATLKQVVGELQDLADGDWLSRLVGDGQLGETARLSDDVRLSQPGRCAVLTALLDLGERRNAAGLGNTLPGTAPSAISLVSAPPDPVPCNATLVSGEPAAVAEDALDWAEDGFTTFKLKLGGADDIEQVRAVREAVGPQAQIRVDANAAWDLATAERVLHELDPLDVQFAEQPVATIEEAARLAATTSIPLAADESVETPEDARRAIDSGAFQLTGIKLSKVGGLLPALLIAEAMPAYVSSALDGPIGIALAGRIASKISHLPWPASGERAHGLATQRLFGSTIATIQCEVRDGMLHPPPGPGLGVEIDEGALEAHRVSP